jgi:spore coat protein U-like protein
MTMGLPSSDQGQCSMTTCSTTLSWLSRCLIAVSSIALGSQACLAATTTTTFNVSLTITSNCTVSATAMAFGSSGIISANIDASSTVTVTCTNTTPYSVGLDAGIGAGATVAVRKMTSGGATVDYSLYQDNGRSTIWGNTVGTNTVGGTGSGSGQALTVYGRVPSQSTPAPGAYSDTITVTVTY